jgi:hypothetical protein
MNENEFGEVPPIFPQTDAAPRPPELPGSKPFSHWLKRFLVCNPFYLASAALLLFGLYRVSVDPGFLTKQADQFEIAQLRFNFGSLQFYEVLLIVTAIFLARRKIWYDSLLLVSLENLLLFVPFILISQAGLIEKRLVWVLCAAGGLLLLGRFGSLKKYFPELNLPNRLAALGAIVVAVNMALPAIYRILGESQAGKKATFGPAYTMNEYAWLLILPAVFALVNFLPPAREAGSLLPQRRWLPAGLFSLWLAGTVVHLYCLGYVYDFDLRRELVAPALWVLAWTLCRRMTVNLEIRPSVSINALIIPPLIIALGSAQNGNNVYLALTALNAVIYGVCFFRRRDDAALRHLAFASIVMLVGGLPEEWMHRILPQFERVHCVAAGTAVYLLLCAMFSRNPKVALLSSIMVGCAVMVLFGDKPGAIHWALQCTLTFLLLHSLQWEDSDHPGSVVLRAGGAVLWVVYSFVWMRFDGQWWMPGIFGLIVLGGCLIARYFRGRWDQLAMPVAALLVLASGPGDFLFERLRAMPAGLLAVIGSFLLFGVGTALALTKHRWHQAR